MTEFVSNLRKEPEATFKEDVSIYFDENPPQANFLTRNTAAPWWKTWVWLESQFEKSTRVDSSRCREGFISKKLRYVLSAFASLWQKRGRQLSNRDTTRAAHNFEQSLVFSNLCYPPNPITYEWTNHGLPAHYSRHPAAG